MVAPLSDVPREGSSVFSLFSLIKLHLASLPLASSYSLVAVSSVFCAQKIFVSAQTRGAPLNYLEHVNTAGVTIATERIQANLSRSYEPSYRLNFRRFEPDFADGIALFLVDLTSCKGHEIASRFEETWRT